MQRSHKRPPRRDRRTQEAIRTLPRLTADLSKKQARRAQLIGEKVVCENAPRAQAKGAARLAGVER